MPPTEARAAGSAGMYAAVGEDRHEVAAGADGDERQTRDVEVAQHGGEDGQRSRPRRSPGAASPDQEPSGSEKSATWTASPSSASGAQRNAHRARPLESPAEQVSRDDPDRDRIEDEHRAGQLGSSRPVADVASSWSTWSSRWPTTNRSATSVTVSSPSRGWSPRGRGSASSSSAQRPREQLEPDRDPGEQLAERQRAVALDDGQPDRRRWRSARTGTASRSPAGCAPSRRASTRASPRRGRASRAVPRTPRRELSNRSASGHGAAGLHGRPGALEPFAGGRGRGRATSSVMALGVWHARRSMGGHDHRSVGPRRLARPARSRGDPR